MTENHVRPVRLKVLLNHFYPDGDHRQKAYVIRQKSWLTVLDLQEHIRKVLKLQGAIYLTVDDGFMLPTCESIGVVCDTDEITVHPVAASSSTFSQLATAFAQTHIESAAESTPGAYTSGMSSPGLGLAHVKKFRADPVQAVNSPLSEGRCSKWVQDAVSTDAPEAKSVDLSEKPKRKRKRKRKSQLEGEFSPAVAEPLEKETSELSSVRQDKSARSHVRFDDDEPAIEMPSRKEIQLSENPFVLPVTARVIRAKVQEVEVSLTNPLCEEQKTIEPSVASDTTEATGITQSESAEPRHPVDATSDNGEAALETMRNHIDQLNLKPVEVKELKENDLIAFKMMKLTENYVPDMSAYIIGLVQSIDGSNVIIFVMAGLDETREPSGKFSLQQEDDSPENSVDQKLLYIQLNEILCAKFVTL